jgi:hypothetical protein
VVPFFDDLAEKHPVLIATHSDVILDALRDPSGSTLLCELDPNRATRLRAVDRDALNSWLVDYRGLGDVRSAGHENSVFTESDAQ